MNSWVEEKTNNKIQNLIKPNMISDATSLMVLNAIYFKGLWREMFDEESTTRATFHVSADKEIEVSTAKVTLIFLKHQNNTLMLTTKSL